MTTQEMKDKYYRLYDEMRVSGDVRQMQIFGSAEKWVFEQVLATNTKLAEHWLMKIEAIRWCNYVCETEAIETAAKLVNQDGTKGAKWDITTMCDVVRKYDGDIEVEGIYNKYALWLVMNMIYSDHARSIAEDMGMCKVMDVPSEKMAMSCYRKAVEKLTDRDRPYFVREYFGLI